MEKASYLRRAGLSRAFFAPQEVLQAEQQLETQVERLAPRSTTFSPFSRGDAGRANADRPLSTKLTAPMTAVHPPPAKRFTPAEWTFHRLNRVYTGYPRCNPPKWTFHRRIRPSTGCPAQPPQNRVSCCAGALMGIPSGQNSRSLAVILILLHILVLIIVTMLIPLLRPLMTCIPQACCPR